MKRPRLSLVVIETDIVTTLYLEVRQNNPLSHTHTQAALIHYRKHCVSVQVEI